MGSMKRWFVYLTILGTLALLAWPASAGRVAKSGTSSIALASSGAARTAAPSLGSTVRFDTTVEPIAGWEYPMVDLWCFQNDQVVFTWLDRPDATYTLGGYSSIWTLNGGGMADCRANLVAIGWKGGQQSARVLASMWFHVNG